MAVGGLVRAAIIAYLKSVTPWVQAQGPGQHNA